MRVFNNVLFLCLPASLGFFIAFLGNLITKSHTRTSREDCLLAVIIRREYNLVEFTDEIVGVDPLRLQFGSFFLCYNRLGELCN